MISRIREKGNDKLLALCVVSIAKLMIRHFFFFFIDPQFLIQDFIN